MSHSGTRTRSRRRLALGLCAVAVVAGAVLLRPDQAPEPTVVRADDAASAESAAPTIRGDASAAASPAASDDHGSRERVVSAPGPAPRHVLRGAVVDAVSREPVPHFRLVWLPAEAGDVREVAGRDPAAGLSRHDLAGRFRIRGLAAGDYSLLVDASSAGRESRVVENVSVPIRDPLVIEVGRGGYVEGRVLDRLERPIAGVEVELWQLSATDASPGRRLHTDDRGRYLFTMVGAGRYELRSSRRSAVEHVTVAPSRGVTRDLRWPWAGALRVRVVDRHGAAVGAADVRLVGRDGARREATTDARGEALIAGLADGAYELAVVRQRGRPVTRSVELWGQADREVPITLPE